MMDAFALGGIVTWFVFVVFSAWFHQYFKSKAQETANRNYVDAVDEVFKTLHRDLVRIVGTTERIEKISKTREQEARLATPRESTRCYAFLLARGIETRLLVQPAATFEQMVEIVNRELGPDWTIMSSAFAEIYVPNSTESIHREKKEESPKVVDFITSLKYAADKFADKPIQKKAVEAIISNIEKHYGRSSSGSPA